LTKAIENENRAIRNRSRKNVGENMERFLFTEYGNPVTVSAWRCSFFAGTTVASRCK
jgi:hypothetical protein